AGAFLAMAEPGVSPDRLGLDRLHPLAVARTEQANEKRPAAFDVIQAMLEVVEPLGLILAGLPVRVNEFEPDSTGGIPALEKWEDAGMKVLPFCEHVAEGGGQENANRGGGHKP